MVNLTPTIENQTQWDEYINGLSTVIKGFKVITGLYIDDSKFIKGTVLTIKEGTIINNTHNIINRGTIINNGTITNHGAIGNNYTIENNGTIKNRGAISSTDWQIKSNYTYQINVQKVKIINNGTITNNDYSTITNNDKCTIMNKGTITNNDKCTITNHGTIENPGKINNNFRDSIIENNGFIYSIHTIQNVKINMIRISNTGTKIGFFDTLVKLNIITIDAQDIWEALVDARNEAWKKKDKEGVVAIPKEKKIIIPQNTEIDFTRNSKIQIYNYGTIENRGILIITGEGTESNKNSQLQMKVGILKNYGTIKNRGVIKIGDETKRVADMLNPNDEDPTFKGVHQVYAGTIRDPILGRLENYKNSIIDNRDGIILFDMGVLTSWSFKQRDEWKKGTLDEKSVYVNDDGQLTRLLVANNMVAEATPYGNIFETQNGMYSRTRKTIPWKVWYTGRSKLKGVFTVAYLKNAGYTVANLKEGGFTATELKNHFTIAELRKDKQFSWFLFTASQLVIEGFNLVELKKGGFTATELKNDFTVANLKKGGFTATELKNDFTVANLKEAGFTIAEFIEGKFTATELKNDYTVDELIKGGPHPLGRIRVTGRDNWAFTLEQLKKEGFTAVELAKENAKVKINIKIVPTVQVRYNGIIYNDDDKDKTSHVKWCQLTAKKIEKYTDSKFTVDTDVGITNYWKIKGGTNDIHKANEKDTSSNYINTFDDTKKMVLFNFNKSLGMKNITKAKIEISFDFYLNPTGKGGRICILKTDGDFYGWERKERDDSLEDTGIYLTGGLMKPFQFGLSKYNERELDLTWSPKEISEGFWPKNLENVSRWKGLFWKDTGDYKDGDIVRHNGDYYQLQDGKSAQALKVEPGTKDKYYDDAWDKSVWDRPNYIDDDEGAFRFNKWHRFHLIIIKDMNNRDPNTDTTTYNQLRGSIQLKIQRYTGPSETKEVLNQYLHEWGNGNKEYWHERLYNEFIGFQEDKHFGVLGNRYTAKNTTPPHLYFFTDNQGEFAENVHFRNIEITDQVYNKETQKYTNVGLPEKSPEHILIVKDEEAKKESGTTPEKDTKETSIPAIISQSSTALDKLLEQMGEKTKEEKPVEATATKAAEPAKVEDKNLKIVNEKIETVSNKIDRINSELMRLEPIYKFNLDQIKESILTSMKWGKKYASTIALATFSSEHKNMLEKMEGDEDKQIEPTKTWYYTPTNERETVNTIYSHSNDDDQWETEWQHMYKSSVEQHYILETRKSDAATSIIKLYPEDRTYVREKGMIYTPWVLSTTNKNRIDGSSLYDTRDSQYHNAVLMSPTFQLKKNFEIQFELMGGKSPNKNIPTYPIPDEKSKVKKGHLGIALFNNSRKEYVAFTGNESNPVMFKNSMKYGGFEPGMNISFFTQEHIYNKYGPSEGYTRLLKDTYSLHLIDSAHGSWGWFGIQNNFKTREVIWEKTVEVEAAKATEPPKVVLVVEDKIQKRN